MAERVVVATAAFSASVCRTTAIIAAVVIRGIVQSTAAAATAGSQAAVVVARGIVQTTPAAATRVVRPTVVVPRRIVGAAPTPAVVAIRGAAPVVAGVVICRVVRAAAPLLPVVGRLLAGGIVLSAPGLNRRDADHQGENGKRERGCRTEYHGCILHGDPERAPAPARFDAAIVTALIYGRP